MTGALETLLERLEQAGYADADGTLLTNDRDWHELRRVLKGHPGWPGLDEGQDARFDPARYMEKTRRHGSGFRAGADSFIAQTRASVMAEHHTPTPPAHEIDPRRPPLRFPNNNRMQELFEAMLCNPRSDANLPLFRYFDRGQRGGKEPSPDHWQAYAAWAAGFHLFTNKEARK